MSTAGNHFDARARLVAAPGSRWRIARLPIMQGVVLCGFGRFLGVPWGRVGSNAVGSIHGLFIQPC